MVASLVVHVLPHTALLIAMTIVVLLMLILHALIYAREVRSRLRAKTLPSGSFLRGSASADRCLSLLRYNAMRCRRCIAVSEPPPRAWPSA